MAPTPLSFEQAVWGGGGWGGVGVHLPGCQLISELLPLSSSKGAVRALSNCHSSLQLIDPSFQQALQHTKAHIMIQAETSSRRPCQQHNYLVADEFPLPRTQCFGRGYKPRSKLYLCTNFQQLCSLHKPPAIGRMRPSFGPLLVPRVLKHEDEVRRYKATEHGIAHP